MPQQLLGISFRKISEWKRSTSGITYALDAEGEHETFFMPSSQGVKFCTLEKQHSH